MTPEPKCSKTGLPDLVVIEPNFTGHRMSFCALIARFVAARGGRITIASSSATWGSDEYRTRFHGLDSIVEKVDLGPLPASRTLHYQRWVIATIRDLQKERPDARLIILEGDELLPVLAVSQVPKPSNISVLLIRPPISARGGAITTFAAKYVGARICESRGIDVVALAPASNPAPQYSVGRWRAAPDPIDVTIDSDSMTWASELSLDRDRFWFGAFGNMARRKNLDLIIDAMSESDPQEMGLFVAGKISAAELQICRPSMDRFRALGGDVRVDNRLLSDTELNSAIGAVDACVIANSGQGPSQIFGKSLAVGTYVVAAGSTVLRDALDAFGGGQWSELSREGLTDTMMAAVRCESILPIALADGAEFVRALIQREP